MRKEREKIEEKYGPIILGYGENDILGCSLLGQKYGEICEIYTNVSYNTDEQLHGKLLELAGITLHLLICLEEEMAIPRARG